MKKWEYCYTGTVVEWNNNLWVVSEVTGKGLRLIDMTCPNVTAYPTEDWPSKNEGVNSVKYVDESVKRYIKNRLVSKFSDLFKF